MFHSNFANTVHIKNSQFCEALHCGAINYGIWLECSVFLDTIYQDGTNNIGRSVLLMVWPLCVLLSTADARCQPKNIPFQWNR